MWLPALTALVALALAASKECPSLFEPYNKATRRLESPGKPFTWREAVGECHKIGPGFELLGRDFMAMTKADRMLCGERWVPFGIRRAAKGKIVWGTGCSYCLEVKEDVDDAMLSLQHTETSTNSSDQHQVGSLDPSTNQWRLETRNKTYTCAICQRAWVSGLGRFNETVPTRPDPYQSVYTFLLVSKGDVSVTEAIGRVEGRFNKSVKAVNIEVLGKEGIGTRVRMKSSASTMVLKSVAGAFGNSSYAVENWQDASWCPASRFDGFDWPGTEVESTWEIILQDFNVVTRRCVALPRSDGDYDAVWEEDVSFWIDHGTKCKSQPALNVARSLQRFAAEPPSNRSTALKTFSKTVARIPKLKWTVYDAQTFYPPRKTFSQNLLNGLAMLLENSKQSDDPTDYCTEDTCVLITGDVHANNDLHALAFSESGAPQLIRGTDSGNQTEPAVVIRFPSTLNSSGHIAVQTFLARNVREAPLFKTIHNLVVKASMAVVVLVSSSIPLTAWRNERAWPVTFEVDNERPRHTYERYFAVWTIGDSEETSLPCPLTKIVGAVDTFVCRSFQSDHKNFTVGRFLVYHRIYSPESDLVRYIEPMVRGYLDTPVDESALQVVADFTDRMVGDEQTFKRRELTSSLSIIGTARDYLQQILHGVVLTGPAITASRRHVKVLVSDLSVDDPVVGFSVDLSGGVGDGTVHNVTAAARNEPTDSEIDVVLGVGTELSFNRLQVLAVTSSTSFYTDTPLGRFIARNVMVVNVAVLANNTLVDGMSNDYYVEIRVDGRGSNGGLQVATWNKVDRDWSVTSCKKRQSLHKGKQVFRCDRLAVADNSLTDRYLVFEQYGFADSLGTPLLAVLIAAGILSGVSLASIVGTAAALPVWRQDLGHKILLHMALALSCNLALGFTSSLVSVDTTSVGCVVVGAFRHFSYLAMFAWMLVMSGLQLRRLISIIGPRNTPNLLIKVCFFAWGLPAISVAALLTFNYKMYQSVVADRGFCYPEGVEFVWTVQAPAATVLVLNAVIFMVILARLYSFCGWGETANLQRHMNEFNFQLRRLRAVFFTFCLFGMTWMLHLLVEQGVFRQKIVYEYLFLMTASVHVLLLSCMFVFFDHNTRKEWRKVSSKIPVAGFTMISLRERSS